MTRSGIIIVVRPLAAKVRGSIEVMRSGRVIDVNELQNAYLQVVLYQLLVY